VHYSCEESQQTNPDGEKDSAMSVEVVDTLVVGAGQAGVAMSEHLSKAGVSHLVLERRRIAERWPLLKRSSHVAPINRACRRSSFARLYM